MPTATLTRESVRDASDQGVNWTCPSHGEIEGVRPSHVEWHQATVDNAYCDRECGEQTDALGRRGALQVVGQLYAIPFGRRFTLGIR